MRKWISLLVMLLVVSMVSSAQVFESAVADLRGSVDASADRFDLRYNAYLGFHIEGSSLLMNITAERDNRLQEALVRVTYQFPGSSAVTSARIDFLEPAELAGDVYIVTITDRVRDVFFWNEGLVSPIKVEGTFEIFGDANVFEVVGYRLGEADYLISRVSLSDDVNIDEVPQPTKEESRLFLVGGGDIPRMVDFELVPRPERQEVLLFPVVEVVAYNFQSRLEFRDGSINVMNFMVPNRVKLFDQDGDLLHTLIYDWRDYRLTDSGFYAERQIIENHVIPGNRTTLTVMDIEVGEFPEELFDPSLLGRN